MTGVLVVFGGGGAGSTSGSERMAWRTARELGRRGHRVDVLTPAAPPDDLADGTLRVHRPASPGGGADTGQGGLAAAVAKRPPDVVHAFDLAHPREVRDALAWARRRGARFALTPATDAALWPDLRAAAEALRAADAVFVLTPAEEETARRHGARADQIHHLPQAPDLVGTADPAGFRRRHGLTGPVVLFLGRRLTGKGFRTLVDAVPLVRRSVPDVAVVFAGPGAPVPDPVPGRLLDLGLVDDRTKHDALAACDVLCLPSTAEVFPLVFAEAWACGKPVVSGDFPGVGAVVRDGVDGLVARAEPAAVAGALVRLLSDDRLRASLGAAGARRSRQEMGWELVADAVESGYRCATAGEGR